MEIKVNEDILQIKGHSRVSRDDLAPSINFETNQWKLVLMVPKSGDEIF